MAHLDVSSGMISAIECEIATEAAVLTQEDGPEFELVPGKPVFMYGTYDLGQVGYRIEEYFISGRACSYQLDGPAGSDGNWTAIPSQSASYKTRVIVIRPVEEDAFNGSVVVEWLTVTTGMDFPGEWMIAHRELLRSGYVYVAVSVQKAGIDGTANAPAAGAVPLRYANPARYESLSHPGDAFSFDIYSQAGRLCRSGQSGGILGALKPQNLLAVGHSLSAAFLTTYINAVDAGAHVFDGFFVHSRYGGGATIGGVPLLLEREEEEFSHVRFREGLRVPVLAFITETDLIGPELIGYYRARRKECDLLRVWEVAGSSHIDGYLLKGRRDDGSLSAVELAGVFRPETQTSNGEVDKLYNPGFPHHYAAQAALSSLNDWAKDGVTPARTMSINLTPGPGRGPALQVDMHGISTGGVRTPWVDAPIMCLSGVGNSGASSPQTDFFAKRIGVGEPFEKAKLEQLYPGGLSDYMARFSRALEAAIRRGHILPADREEILGIAAINYEAAIAPQ